MLRSYELGLIRILSPVSNADHRSCTICLPTCDNIVHTVCCHLVYSGSIVKLYYAGVHEIRLFDARYAGDAQTTHNPKSNTATVLQKWYSTVVRKQCLTVSKYYYPKQYSIIYNIITMLPEPEWERFRKFPLGYENYILFPGKQQTIKTVYLFVILFSKYMGTFFMI